MIRGLWCGRQSGIDKNLVSWSQSLHCIRVGSGLHGGAELGLTNRVDATSEVVIGSEKPHIRRQSLPQGDYNLNRQDRQRK